MAIQVIDGGEIQISIVRLLEALLEIFVLAFELLNFLHKLVGKLLPYRVVDGLVGGKANGDC